MFFKKKSKKNEIKCPECASSLDSKKYRFCPYCGAYLDKENEIREFGMLGQTDMDEEEMMEQMLRDSGFSFADKILNSLVQQLMKTLNQQLNNIEKSEFAEVKTFPNGIKIKISPNAPAKNEVEQKVPEPTKKQIEKMISLPKAEAKTTIKRLSDKIIYELNTPGIESKEDVFISKLESGYEIKAIGKNKVYVNSFPINLPLKGYWLKEKGIVFEFSLQ